MTNWDEVEKLVREYVRLLETEQRYYGDIDHHVMDEVLIAVFGDDIFDRINPLLKEL